MQVQTRAITFEDDTPSVTIQNPYLDAARAAGVNVLEPDLPWWKLQHPPEWANSYTSVVDFRKTRVVDLQAILVELNQRLVAEEHARGVR